VALSAQARLEEGKWQHLNSTLKKDNDDDYHDNGDEW